MHTSRAAVMVSPGKIDIQSFSIPEPVPGAVIMKVNLSGI